MSIGRFVDFHTIVRRSCKNTGGSSSSTSEPESEGEGCLAAGQKSVFACLYLHAQIQLLSYL